MSEEVVLTPRRRGRPPGSKNKQPAPYIASTGAPMAESGALVPFEDNPSTPPIKFPKPPSSLPSHRKGRGYSAPWRQLEETLELLPQTVMQRISTQHEIDLLVGRVEDLVKRLEEGESREAWKDFKKQVLDMERAKRAGDTDSFFQGWDTLVATVIFGEREAQTWDDIYLAIENLRRLKETELKRHAQEVTSMAREDVLQVVQEQQQMFRYAVVGAITDPRIQQQVLAYYQRLIDQKFNVGAVIQDDAEEAEIVEVSDE